MKAPEPWTAGLGDLLARRMGGLARLMPAERALLGLSSTTRLHHPGEELIEQGTPLRDARIILSGWAGTMRILPDGRRQIFRVLLPGDLFGVASHPSPLALASMVALTAIETMDMEPALAAMRAEPFGGGLLHTALMAGAAAEEAALLDHVMRLGRQTALERTAHLLLELQQRLSAVGLGTDRHFPLPLTQEMMADLLGLSTVHMNRTLQELRRARLIRLDRGRVELLEPARLAGIADYAVPRFSDART